MDIVGLLKQMTLEEKVNQLTDGSFKKILDLKTLKIKENALDIFPNGIGMFSRVAGSTDLTPREVAIATNNIQKHLIENTRLKIPALFTTEGTSGALARSFTLFPSNLNIGSVFDESKTYLMGDAIGKELRSVGENWALAPVVDIIREYRYGRYEESYGEDTYLVTQNGIAYVKGLQGDMKTGVAATLKHYVAQGISDGGRNAGPVHLAQRELLNEYIVPFEACIKEANPATIMAAYHEIDGVPTHVSKYLLQDILREKLGFEGIIVSDGNGVQLVNHYQEYCKTLEEATTLCMNAGIDIELDNVFQRFLVKEVEKGNVSIERINNAVLRVLNLKEKLGLFENPYVDVNKVEKIVMCRKHIDISYDIAVDSIIMLENKNNILPINKDKKVGLVGPLSNSKKFAYGDYSYPTHVNESYNLCQDLSEEEIMARSLFTMTRSKDFNELFHDTTTIYEELSKRYSVVQRDLLKDTYNYDNDKNFESYSFDKEIRSCDLFVIVLGETSGMGYKNDTGESTDRTSITLSKEQRNLLIRLKELNKPLILVLSNAKPVELTLEKEVCDGILETFKTGYKGAKAICDILDGTVSPSGKLPVTIPKDIGQCPIYYSQRITGKKQFWKNRYLEMDLEPLYEFGYGLSYTKFDVNVVNVEFHNNIIKSDVKVKNIGNVFGKEVIQLYVRKRFTSVAQPDRELKNYKKVSLNPGEEVLMNIDLNIDSLGYYNIDYDFCVENMDLTVMVGTSSKNIIYERTFELIFKGGKKIIEKKVFAQ
ncbi:MAG: glycoside hydrolase family 3 N-terminal domain-containing protein [Eubacteriales bacterium]